MIDTITSIPGAAATNAEHAPSGAPSEAPAFRRSRPSVADTIAEKPMPDFTSSLGLFLKEQKLRPVRGVRGAIFNMTGGPGT